MQFVPVKRPLSGRGWRALILLFAGLLTFGVFQPITASAAHPALLKVKDTVVVEGDSATTTALVKVVLSKRVHHKKVSVGFVTKDGTAKAGADYVATSGRVWFPKGSRVKFVKVSVIGDKVVEADEYFKVRLFDAHRAVIADRVGKVWIENDDKPTPPPPADPKLTVGDTKVDEGGIAHFKVALSAKATKTVTFDFETSDGTAVVTKDYDKAIGVNKAIPIGEDHVWIPVQTRQDDLFEGPETFFLDVSDVHNAVPVDARGVGLILDDDKPLPKLWVRGDDVDEGGKAHFKVFLSDPAPQDVSFRYTTLDDSAKSPQDYESTGGLAVIKKGDSVFRIPVQTNPDSLDEFDEVFFLRVYDVSHARVVDDRGKGTIIDDDPLPNLAINDVTATAEDSHAVLKVNLSEKSGKTVTVRWETVNGTAPGGALAGHDYVADHGMLTFAPGDLEKQIPVEVLKDNTPEGVETFKVRLSDPVHATINQFHNPGTVTIPANTT